MSESATPPGDPFELLRKLWAPTGLPVPGMAVPTLDAGEIDRRIADLRRVENWMNVNLNVLRMSIQSLEMQKATLAVMAAATTTPAQAKSDPNAPPGASTPSLADAWWQMFQQMSAAAAAAQQAGPEASEPPAPPQSGARPAATKGKKEG